MKILITCCLGDQMRENIVDMRNAFEDVYIIGVDAREMLGNFVGVDKFYKVHRCNDPIYVDEIVDISKNNDVDLIISFSSFDIMPFKANLSRIPCKVALTFNDNLVIANEKRSFYEFAKEHDVPIPISSDVLHDGSELKDFMDQHGMKRVVTKKILSTGAVGMNEYSIDNVMKECGYSEEGFIGQELLTGTEYSVDCFCKHGEVLFSCVKKHSMMDLGMTIYSEVVKDDYVAGVCEDACMKLRIDGLIGFDLKKNDEGKVFIIDSNPRVTGTVSLIAKAGVNLLKHLVEYYMYGDTDFSGEVLQYGLKIARFRKDYFFRTEDELWKLLQ